MTAFEINPASLGDDRLSHLSFIWRGIARSEAMMQIENAFQSTIVDLKKAMEAGSVFDVEYALAPLILLCKSTTDAEQIRLEDRRQSFRFVLIAYILGIAVAVVVAAFPLLIRYTAGTAGL